LIAHVEHSVVAFLYIPLNYAKHLRATGAFFPSNISKGIALALGKDFASPFGDKIVNVRSKATLFFSISALPPHWYHTVYQKIKHWKNFSICYWKSSIAWIAWAANCFWPHNYIRTSCVLRSILKQTRNSAEWNSGVFCLLYYLFSASVHAPQKSTAYSGGPIWIKLLRPRLTEFRGNLCLLIAGNASCEMRTGMFWEIQTEVQFGCIFFFWLLTKPYPHNKSLLVNINGERYSTIVAVIYIKIKRFAKRIGQGLESINWNRNQNFSIL
jgi:hypothetical protein